MPTFTIISNANAIVKSSAKPVWLIQIQSLGI